MGLQFWCKHQGKAARRPNWTEFVSPSQRRNGRDLVWFQQELLGLIASARDDGQFAAAVCRVIGQWSESAAIWLENVSGVWWPVASHPVEAALHPPTDLLENVSDSDAIQRQATWTAIPLSRREGNEILVLRQRGAEIPDDALTIVAEAVAQARLVVRRVRHAEMWHVFQDLVAELHSHAKTMTLEGTRHVLLKLRANLEAFWQLDLALAYAAPKRTGADWTPIMDPDPMTVGREELNQLWELAHNESTTRWRSPADQEVETTLTGDEARGSKAFLAARLIGEHNRPFGLVILVRGNRRPFTYGDAIDLGALTAECREVFYRTAITIAGEQQSRRPATAYQLLGGAPGIREVQRRIERIAATDLPVLILGENGTGKEVVSRLIHSKSLRRTKPFVAVNCATLTETLLESELFGHEKGAFTDAHETRAGKFETASGGTLFLDEVGELSLRAQSQLLRVLDDHRVVRVGGHETISVDTRLLAATNRDLTEMVREKSFREDLFFRLNVVAIELPPLRDRGDDILLLAESFLEHLAQKANQSRPELTGSARNALLRHPWPGNVRELRNLMERAVFLFPGRALKEEDLGLSAAAATRDFGVESDLPLNEATRKFQIAFIDGQIQACRGNMTEAASRLGLHRTNLYRKMRQLGMGHPDDDSEGSQFETG